MAVLLVPRSKAFILRCSSDIGMPSEVSPPRSLRSCLA